MPIIKDDYGALENHLRRMLGIADHPIGFYYTDQDPPEGAITIKKRRGFASTPSSTRLGRARPCIFHGNGRRAAVARFISDIRRA